MRNIKIEKVKNSKVEIVKIEDKTFLRTIDGSLFPFEFTGAPISGTIKNGEEVYKRYRDYLNS